jgi:hypothetical protein
MENYPNQALGNDCSNAYDYRFSSALRAFIFSIEYYSSDLWKPGESRNFISIKTYGLVHSKHHSKEIPINYLYVSFIQNSQVLELYNRGGKAAV